jgi:DNA helicase HerA-like ATPase
MLVLEEAHLYCPQAENVASKKAIITIASEGRKFGLGLMAISQRPAKVDRNVLGLCAMQIMLKVTNPNDLTAILDSVEGLTSGLEQDLASLPQGTAIMVGAGIQKPLIVEIRPRETRHGVPDIQVTEDDDDE